MAKTTEARDSKRERRTQAKVERERARRRAERARMARTGGVAAVIVIVLGVVGFSLFRSSASGVAWAGTPQQGGTITKLVLPQLRGGGTVTYDQFRDKPLVLNFFASWCPFCVGEMPGFQQVHQQLGDKVAFLGVSNKDSASASQALMQRTGVTYPAGKDPNGVFYAATGSAGMPTTLFIKPGGQVAEVYVGPLDPQALQQHIQQDFGVTS